MNAGKDPAVATSPIFVETQNLLDSLRSNEDKLSKLKDSIDQKETYVQQLRVHLNAIESENAKKRGTLDAHENFAKMVNEKNSEIREGARKIVDHCKAAYRDRNGVVPLVDEHRNKLENLKRGLSKRNESYEMRFDELSNSLRKIMAENKRKLVESNLRKSEVRKRAKLETELKRLDDEEAALECEDDPFALEKDLVELEAKLVALNEAKIRSINEFDADCEATIAKNNDFIDALERQCRDLEDEVSSRSKINDELAKRGEELSQSFRTLRICKENLDGELTRAADARKLLADESGAAVASAEAEAEQIRKDVAERRVKYFEMERGKTKLLQEMEHVEAETAVDTEQLNELKRELRAVHDDLRTMEVTETELTERYDSIVAENERLERLAFEKRQNQRELTEKIDASVREGDETIAEMTARFNASRTLLENETEPTETTKRNLERDIDELESRLNEAKRKKVELNAERDRIKEELKRANAKLDETSQRAKRFSVLIDEAKKTVAEAERSAGEFVSPQAVTKPARQRHWDSDSSMETETVKELLRRKQRKFRQRTGKSGKLKE